MKTYRNEIIYACILSVGISACAVCILLGYYNVALLTLLISSVFILLELYSLFVRLDGGTGGRVSSSTASLVPDPYSMPDPYLDGDFSDDGEFSFTDGIDAVSEPVIIHNKED